MGFRDLDPDSTHYYMDIQRTLDMNRRLKITGLLVLIFVVIPVCCLITTTDDPAFLMIIFLFVTLLLYALIFAFRIQSFNTHHGSIGEDHFVFPLDQKNIKSFGVKYPKKQMKWMDVKNIYYIQKGGQFTHDFSSYYEKVEQNNFDIIEIKKLLRYSDYIYMVTKHYHIFVNRNIIKDEEFRSFFLTFMDRMMTNNPSALFGTKGEQFYVCMEKYCLDQ